MPFSNFNTRSPLGGPADPTQSQRIMKILNSDRVGVGLDTIHTLLNGTSCLPQYNDTPSNSNKTLGS